MGLYDVLEKNQRKTNFEKSSEMAFFLANRVLLNDIEPFAGFQKAQDPFGVVRANIIIRSLVNKETIEKLYRTKTKGMKKGEGSSTSLDEFMRDSISELPYLKQGAEKIYVAFFPASINVIYSRQYEKLGVPPYERLVRQFAASTIDPFDYYGQALFESYFTKYIVIARNAKTIAAYDYDSNALYFIDDEGRLEAKLCFFDRYLRHHDTNNLIDRLEPVAAAYFADDKPGLIKTLLDSRLVSSRLLGRIEKSEAGFESALAKKKAQ